MTDFPESDWKKLRIIKLKALDRYCRRVLDHLRVTLNAPQETNAHQIYLDTYRIIKKDDELLADLFNDWRRSSADITLMGWLNHGLITHAEFENFSDDTKAHISHWAEPSFYQEDTE
jgi:hypothetical protein